MGGTRCQRPAIPLLTGYSSTDSGVIVMFKPVDQFDFYLASLDLILSVLAVQLYNIYIR
jgi:hypothetical protein